MYSGQCSPAFDEYVLIAMAKSSILRIEEMFECVVLSFGDIMKQNLAR